MLGLVKVLHFKLLPEYKKLIELNNSRERLSQHFAVLQTSRNTDIGSFEFWMPQTSALRNISKIWQKSNLLSQ